MSEENKELNCYKLSRRDFLKVAGLAIGTLALRNFKPVGWEDVKNSPDMGADLAPNPELLPKEERKGVLTTDNMPVFLFPLWENSWLNRYYRSWVQKVPEPVKEIKLKEMDLSFKDLFLSINSDGTAARYTVFPFITGDKYAAIGMYDKGLYNSQTRVYTPNQRFYKNEVLNKDMGVPVAQGHTLIASFYPNKDWNDLEASQKIDEYQHRIGGFRAGVPVSYVDMVLAFGGDISKEYRFGRAGFAAGLVPGGGACATATNMCKTQVASGATIVERQMHGVGSRYWVGPGEPIELSQRNADATIYWQVDNLYREDLKYVPQKDQWIKISAAFIPIAPPVAATAREGDIVMFLTYRVVDHNPGNQSQKLQKLQDAYDAWRANPSESSKKALLDGNALTQNINWTAGCEIAELKNSIVPEDRVSRFTQEMANEPILKGTFQLQSLLRGYSYDAHYKFGIYLGDYLRNSDWYEAQITRLNAQGDSTGDFEKALNQLSGDCNMLHYQQPLQCVGLDILMSALKYPGYPFYNFYDYEAGNAKTLTPWSWRVMVGDAIEKYTFANWQEIEKVVNRLQPVEGSDIRGRKFTAFNAKSLEEIQVGDIFVNMEGTDGHTGVIIGKKTVDGKTVLLLADANASVDGQIHIHEVDECNFDIVFGSYPYPKTMIRKK